jgi:hypothetical protein
MVEPALARYMLARPAPLSRSPSRPSVLRRPPSRHPCREPEPAALGPASAVRRAGVLELTAFDAARIARRRSLPPSLAGMVRSAWALSGLEPGRGHPGHTGLITGTTT